MFKLVFLVTLESSAPLSSRKLSWWRDVQASREPVWTNSVQDIIWHWWWSINKESLKVLSVIRLHLPLSVEPFPSSLFHYDLIEDFIFIYYVTCTVLMEDDSRTKTRASIWTVGVGSLKTLHGEKQQQNIGEEVSMERLQRVINLVLRRVGLNSRASRSVIVMAARTRYEKPGKQKEEEIQIETPAFIGTSRRIFFMRKVRCGHHHFWTASFISRDQGRSRALIL